MLFKWFYYFSSLFTDSLNGQSNKNRSARQRALRVAATLPTDITDRIIIIIITIIKYDADKMDVNNALLYKYDSNIERNMTNIIIEINRMII